ncbi:MAG: hypothetical protein LC667_20450, partial [Thioalkalivibrio sp.]|nr:hypothetical protein [Thioalkalivibrio sp.]
MSNMYAAHEVRSQAERFGVQSNWGRWGDHDQRGTLNLIGVENVRRGVTSVREGVVVSLGRPLDVEAPPYYPQGLD